jgi:hypothetical protein
MLRSRFLPIYGLAFLCAALFILEFKGWPPPFAVEMKVQTDRYARLQLLYDDGAGYRWHSALTLAMDGTDWIKFPVLASQIRNLSLLQYGGTELLRVRQAHIKMLGRKPLQISADQIRPGYAGTNVTQKNGAAEIRGINGNANVAITLPTTLRESRPSRRLHNGIVIFLCIGLVALAVLVLTGRDLADSAAFSEPKQRLIRNATLVFLTSVYLLAGAAKLNGSATALWRIYADGQAPNVGLLLGTPKDIRSDEWVGVTPWIFSQAARRFAVENPGVGDGVMPLLNNLPARHWTMLFRPQMWLFFVTDFEYAFAFYWNLKWFSFLLGAFLFLRSIARGNSVVALFGALLLFFSAFIQWWFSTPTCMPEMIGAFFLALWSLVIIASANSRWKIVGGAILLVASVAQFIFCAYPRFQIQLIHLGLFVVAGTLIAQWHRIFSKPFAGFRLGVFATAIILSALVGAAWYHDVADAIHRVSALAYPGKVFSTGGRLPWQRLFMPFLEFAMSDQRYPPGHMNVCDAAGFLFFAPLIAVMVARDVLRRYFDPIMIASFAFIAFGLWFMLFGFSPALAKWTGFCLVYSIFVVLAVSIASTIALCRYLSRSNGQQYLSSAAGLAVLFVLGLVLFAVFQSTNRPLRGFVDTRQVVATSVYFAVVFAALWHRQVVIASILILIPAIYSTALVNPIGRGLAGITQSGTFHWLSEIARQRPEARWLVVGPPSGRTNFMPQLVKATGADTIGGFRCEPDQRMVRALDPTGKYAAVYSRYAEISFLPSMQAESSFELTFINHYNVLLPLRPEFLRRLGVTFILETETPEAEGAIAGYSVVGEREGLRLLKKEGTR